MWVQSPQRVLLGIRKLTTNLSDVRTGRAFTEVSTKHVLQRCCAHCIVAAVMRARNTYTISAMLALPSFNFESLRSDFSTISWGVGGFVVFAGISSNFLWHPCTDLLPLLCCCCSAATLLLLCRCSAAALPPHCCCSAAAMLLLCCYSHSPVHLWVYTTV